MQSQHVTYLFVISFAVVLFAACGAPHSVPNAQSVMPANTAEVRPVPTVPASGATPLPTASASAVAVVAARIVPPPAPIPQPDHIVRIAVTDGRACAIFDNGMLQCWGGFNFNGELGQGHKGAPVAPNWVKGIYGVAKVSLSRNASCAIRGAGELHCWGENRFFEADSRSEFMAPMRVPELADIVDVAVSGRHGCAVDRGGAVYCWGNNGDGQLGFGVAEIGKTFKKPAQVAGIADAVGVAVSDSTTVVWTKGGDLYRWGMASDPNRSYADATPHKMAILSGVQRAQMESQQVCSLLAAGQVRCFSHETLQDFLAGKEHDFGPELAGLVKALTRRKVVPIPKHFVFPDGRGLSGVIDMAVFNHDASAVTDTGEVYSWGSAERGTTGRPNKTKGFFPPTRIQGFTNAVAIVGSFRHRCGLERNGEVRCFGAQRFLGTDSLKDSIGAVVVKGLPKIVHIASNEDCTFALAEDHSLWAWGENVAHACGLPTEERALRLPTRVPVAQSVP